MFTDKAEGRYHSTEIGHLFVLHFISYLHSYLLARA